MSRITCVYHCGQCHTHHASLESFDAHREGDHQEGTRHCLDPIDALDKHGAPRFAAKSEDGACSVGRNYVDPKHGVTVWQLARAAAKGARPVLSVRRQPPKATGDHFGTETYPKAA